MKIFNYALAFGAFMLSTCAFGQKYEQVYANATPEIQARLNENKIAGIPILTGVRAEHHASLSGLTGLEIAAASLSLQSDARIESVSIAPDGSTIAIFSAADFAREDLEVILSQSGASIIAYSAAYTLLPE